ncbi:MAG TPA: serine/threonine-protein kinase [Archangium sp.]|uniref:serine/threonine protein kinase n=1 Tax=Archangium sp. TaxID=1872627 RepID=UPI002E3716B0|nr:serine/threonine-protein kinase [Archangium sp.]HEX5754044.1 serine/threonine-protein kinase [Archangium sp.]
MFDEGNPLWGAVPELTPGTQVAGFTVEGTIASGSFGTVYRARRSGKPYAVKLVALHPRGDREAAALRLVRHPNVVTFHGYGLWPEEEPRFLVLALELVEGLTLDAWAARENPSALELVMRVLLPLALTLADVHASGVVHRDIKEANIIMRESDGQPVLVDFGAAGLKEGALRLTMRLPPGTAEYRSPEVLRFARQWEGEHYPFSPGDDLWALGVVIYGLLTRTLPFGDRNNPGLNRAILEETPPAPHELNPRVPPVLSDVCMALLEKKLEDRYPDAKALAEDLLEQCTQADSSWRTPMFPRSGHNSPPVPAKPGRHFSRWWWAASGLGLTSALALLLYALHGGTPRTASPSAHATLQDASGQEVVPPARVAEATPSAAPLPAPVAAATNNEEPTMQKSKTIRTLVAAGCVASAGCVSTPKARPQPPPEECPPGAVEAHARYELGFKAAHGAILGTMRQGGRLMPVREGEISAEIIGPWGLFPDWTIFTGRLYFGAERVYGRFTKATLPGGETVPVCLQMMTIGVYPPLGVALETGSTAARPIIHSSVSVQAVERFE